MVWQSINRTVKGYRDEIEWTISHANERRFQSSYTGWYLLELSTTYGRKRTVEYFSRLKGYWRYTRLIVQEVHCRLLNIQIQSPILKNDNLTPKADTRDNTSNDSTPQIYFKWRTHWPQLLNLFLCHQFFLYNKITISSFCLRYYIVSAEMATCANTIYGNIRVCCNQKRV